MNRDSAPVPMNISLPKAESDFVEMRVASGDFRSAGEYISELIRGDQRRMTQEELTKKLLEGMDSGPATEMTAEDWKRLRGELARRCQGRAS